MSIDAFRTNGSSPPATTPNGRLKGRPARSPVGPVSARAVRRHPFLLIIASLVVTLGLSACASSGDGKGASPSSGSTSAQCRAGDTVERPSTNDGVPPCAEHGAVTLTYGCYPKRGGPQRGSWYAVHIGNQELYGKPGGKWVTAKSPDKLDEAAIKSIGC